LFILFTQVVVNESRVKRVRKVEDRPDNMLKRYTVY